MNDTELSRNIYKNTELSDMSLHINGILLKEEWLSIVGYEGKYMVSNFGGLKVFNKQNSGYNAIMNQNTTGNKRGYLLTQLWSNNTPKTLQVHRIVAQAFIENPENKETVNHINGIKTDNTVWNLEWNTRSENMLHAARVLGHYSGVNSGRSKFTEKDVLDIFYSSGTEREIAAKYNVSHSVIGFIKRKQSYKSILKNHFR